MTCLEEESVDIVRSLKCDRRVKFVANILDIPLSPLIADSASAFSEDCSCAFGVSIRMHVLNRPSKDCLCSFSAIANVRRELAASALTQITRCLASPTDAVAVPKQKKA